METNPHTHTPYIEREIPELFFHWRARWVLVYGDTRVVVAKGGRHPRYWAPEKQERVLGEAVRKAIRQHDEGTRRAAMVEVQRKERERSMMKSLNVIPYGKYGVWGSDLLEEQEQKLLTK